MGFKKAILALVIFCFISTGAMAGDFSDRFQTMIQDADLDEIIHGMVFVNGAFDAYRVGQDLSASGYSLAERHEAVVAGLKETAAMTQAGILEQLMGYDSTDIKFVRSFWIANAIEIKATRAVFEGLAGRRDVFLIREIPQIELIAPFESFDIDGGGKGIENGVLNSRAPELWALGITGSTALVCDVDTGADGNHPTFATRWFGLDPGVTVAQSWYDPVTSTTFPTEFGGSSHGTHTMGTILGDDGGENQIGMAPGAKWIAAGVIDRVNLDQTLADAYAAFEWAADPDGDPTTNDDVPDVISNSWRYRSSWGYPECDDFMQPAIDGAEAAGAVVIFAAGNEGYAGAGSIGIPSMRIDSEVNVFSIGALNQDGVTIAGFSSLGPSSCDNTTIKPEISAIGVDVRSALKNGGYGTKSGTSMATPHVSGAVALLRDAFPEVTPYDVKYALLISTVDLGPAGEDNTFGTGRLDVMAAFNYLCANGYGDYDTDGYDSLVCGGDDCNDRDENINPGQVELCNGFDDNCNDATDEGGDALCDNGLWCDGAETCLGESGCDVGAPPCVEDGLWCNGAATCDEAADQCGHEFPGGTRCSDDGLWCNGSELCDEDADACYHEMTPLERCPDDILWCNGIESCDEDNDACVHEMTPQERCPDDALWCNGAEVCDETADICVHETTAELLCPDDGAYCSGIESCDEDNDQCVSSGNPCPDDGLYCNGSELCDEGGDHCFSAGSPCEDNEDCDEDNDECLSDDETFDDDDSTPDDDDSKLDDNDSSQDDIDISGCSGCGF